MYIRHLEIYVNVVNYRSFSKAAEAIFLSQPSVSSCINSLEKELDTQLLFRTTKEVYPTQAGNYFYEQAKHILSIYKKTKTKIAEMKFPGKDKNFEAEIEILASSVPSLYILPELISEFHREYPNVSFKIIQADSIETVKAVVSQRHEIGIVGAKIDTNKCNYTRILSERLVLISSDKRQANSTFILRDFLETNDFIAREQGSGTKLVYDGFFKDLGIKPSAIKNRATFSNTQSVVNAVSKGLGAAIVSEIAARQYIENGLVHELQTDVTLPSRDFFLVSKKDFVFSYATEAFVEFVVRNEIFNK